MNVSKQALRQLYSARRRELSEIQRREESAAVCAALMPLTRDASWIASYRSDGVEVDLDVFHEAVLQRGQKLYFPRLAKDGKQYEMACVSSLEKNWKEGAYHLPEPDENCPAWAEAEQNGASGVCLVPGVAFTREGIRLGRGKAVYDRLLTSMKTLRVGIFYDCQEAVSIPQEAHDAPLDCVVTGKRTLVFHAEHSEPKPKTLRGDLK